jgi:hypothetical protein
LSLSHGSRTEVHLDERRSFYGSTVRVYSVRRAVRTLARRTVTLDSAHATAVEHAALSLPLPLTHTQPNQPYRTRTFEHKPQPSRAPAHKAQWTLNAQYRHAAWAIPIYSTAYRGLDGLQPDFISKKEGRKVPPRSPHSHDVARTGRRLPQKRRKTRQAASRLKVDGGADGRVERWAIRLRPTSHGRRPTWINGS